MNKREGEFVVRMRTDASGCECESGGRKAVFFVDGICGGSSSSTVVVVVGKSGHPQIVLGLAFCMGSFWDQVLVRSL
jgi:hypothetical protein